MIEILSHSQLSGTPDRAHQLFSQRYHVFVKRLGWRVPTRGYYEFDRYDQDGTEYVLALDDTGELKGSCRLLPTTTPKVPGRVTPVTSSAGASADGICKTSRAWYQVLGRLSPRCMSLASNAAPLAVREPCSAQLLLPGIAKPSSSRGPVAVSTGGGPGSGSAGNV